MGLHEITHTELHTPCRWLAAMMLTPVGSSFSFLLLPFGGKKTVTSGMDALGAVTCPSRALENGAGAVPLGTLCRPLGGPRARGGTLGIM